MNPLKIKIFQLIILLALTPLIHSHDLRAETALQCHCFTDRSYNSADRFAADGYILATSFNSLLSKYYGIPKRQIVIIKMKGGVAQDELLVSLKTAQVTRIDFRKFLRLRSENNSWAKIISGLKHQEAIKKDEILAAIKSGLPVAEAGVRVADEMIAEFYRVPAEEIKMLRMSGLNEKEMALLFILARNSDTQPQKLMGQYKYHGRSWSEIASNLGVKPEAVAQLIQVYPAETNPL